ncbi:ATP-binding cassette sub-family C member 8-like [Antedon mediterranea]|uniref:ATP-binding cassette sub-family C member 8-like n=1 Tax=Antedon mediterranea TaxID=105859 RepID=UPI003AF4258E
MYAIEKFNWFCGDDANVSFDNFTWDKSSTVDNACFIGLISSGISVLFVILASSILLVLANFTALKNLNHKYLIAFPGHVPRWLLNVLLLVLQLSRVSEGIITDVIVHENQETEPYLYVPACACFISMVMYFIYYHHVEYWNKPFMISLVLLYWLCMLACDVLTLESAIDDDWKEFNVLRYDLVIASIVITSLYVLMEIYVILHKICCSDDELPSDLKKTNMHFMQGFCTLMSSATYWWLNGLFRKGYKEPIELEDLGVLSKSHKARQNRMLFEEALEKERARALAKGVEINLYRVFIKVFGLRLGMAGGLKLCGDSLSFVGPIALKYLLLYVTGLEAKPQKDDLYVTVDVFLQNGYVLLVIIFFASVLKSLCLQSHYQIVIIESIHLRAAIQASVYDKALNLSTWTMTGGSMTMGQITNLMSVDAMNLLNSFQWVHYIWSIPYQLGISLYILYKTLGYSALVGFCVFFVTMPLQTVIAGILAGFQKIIMANSDERLKRINEMLQGIKLIKLYGWEDLFLCNIKEARANEVHVRMKGSLWSSALTTTTIASPLLVTLVAYGLYEVFEGTPLTPDVAFSSLSLFNQITIPLFVMPMTFTFLVNAHVSTKRLQNFLQSPECEERDDGRQKIEVVLDRDKSTIEDDDDLNTACRLPPNKLRSKRRINSDRTLLVNAADGNQYGTFSTSNAIPTSIDISDDLILKIENGNFTWDVDSPLPTLANINMEIPAGKLTMIVGAVGSGKSSVLAAMLGEMSTLSGNVQWNRHKSTVSFASQKAWLINASLKENILFGYCGETERYESVISSCALKPDIDILPAGDQTEIGEKGINLSGGQKQRISVARAMYSYNDVVILDDPLSALDVHVGRQVFEEGIVGLLLNNDRTAILVTHQVQYVEKADWIIVMKEGQIQHQGTLTDIEQKDPELYMEWQTLIQESQQKEKEQPDSDAEEQVVVERRKLKKQVSVISVGSQDEDEMFIKKSGADKDDETGKLIEKEERVKGSVGFKMYGDYINQLRIPIFVMVLCLILLYNGCSVANNFWLSAWSNAGIGLQKNESSAVLRKYLGGYAGLSVTSIILSTVSSLTMILSALYASKRMHNTMLKRVMFSPLRFFDTTPIGRILNRFSSDIQTLDGQLGSSLNSFLVFSMNCVSAIIVNTIVSYFFIFICIPMTILYVVMMKFFITTSRELQRLDSISKSPVFAHFSESLGGLPTIRAYCLQNSFRDTILTKIDKNNVAYVYIQTANRWLGVRLDFIGSLVVLLAGITSMSTGNDPGLVGLSITYALSMAGQLNWLVRMAATVEMSMNSVERVHYYSKLQMEKYDGIRDPPLNWPNKGEIVLDDISVRYAADLDPVLHDVTVTLQAGDKVGICGRTGSGKSSLTLALFRVIDTFRGRVIVDGVDIASLPLTALRRKIAIIPQDPVLFTGTIRYNLDPQGNKSDNELWEALEIAQLKPTVSTQQDGLESLVTEGGENYSVGQRQLFCLARAFLKKTNILVMDEATASIDMQTDAILQEVVATAFKDRTVLTIAHRIATILNSDKILVLDAGRMIEFDTPDALLERDSVFASLVRNDK